MTTAIYESTRAAFLRLPRLNVPGWPGGVFSSGLRDVRQALLDGLDQRVAVRQDALAARGGVSEQGHRVADPAHRVVQVRQAGPPGQRVGVVGTEDPFGVR